MGKGCVGERGEGVIGRRGRRKVVCVNGEGGRGGYAGYSSLGIRLCPALEFMVMSFAWTAVALL